MKALTEAAQATGTKPDVARGVRRARFRRVGLAAVLLVGLTVFWAWGSYDDALAMERNRTLRHADSLAKGLSVLIHQLGGDAPIHDDRLAEQVRKHLTFRPPIHYAKLTRASRIIAEVGETPGIGDDHRQLMMATPRLMGRFKPERARRRQARRGPGRHGPPPGARRPKGPPWEWVDRDQTSASDAEPLRLTVGLHTGFPRHRRDDLFWRLGIRAALVWLAFATLAFAWVRNGRSVDLAAELEREHRARARLEELNLAAAGLAHETKNPLGLIRGIAQRLAAATSPEDPAHDAAEGIMDEADRASARLNDFLNFASAPKPALAEVSIAEIVSAVARTLRPDFQQAGVELSESLAQGQVLCDMGMLEQVLVNLLLNSLHACSAQRRHASAVEIRFATDSGAGTLSVVDNGIGISPSLLPDIFKPYVTGRPNGHGLGLAVVRRIVEQHGWTIRASSEFGRGSTFAIENMTLTPSGDIPSGASS